MPSLQIVHHFCSQHKNTQTLVMTKVAAQPRRRRKKNTQRRALAEIRKFQSGKYATSQLIPKSCFSRMARNLASKRGHGIRFQEQALASLQHAAEDFLVDMLTEANKCCAASGRMTLQANDLRLAISIATKKPFKAVSSEVEQQAGEDEYASEDETEEIAIIGDESALENDDVYTSAEETEDEINEDTDNTTE